MNIFARTVEAAQTAMLRLFQRGPVPEENNDRFVSSLLLYQAGQYHIYKPPARYGGPKQLVHLLSVAYEREFQERIWWVENITSGGREPVGYSERDMSPHALTEMEVIAWAAKDD